MIFCYDYWEKNRLPACGERSYGSKRGIQKTRFRTYWLRMYNRLIEAIRGHPCDSKTSRG